MEEIFQCTTAFTTVGYEIALNGVSYFCIIMSTRSINLLFWPFIMLYN